MKLTLLSAAAGLVWGVAVAFLNAFITKKMASRGDRALAAGGLIRTLVDAAALAAVFLLRNVIPLRYEVVLIATAIALSLVSIVLSYRLAASMKK